MQVGSDPRDLDDGHQIERQPADRFIAETALGEGEGLDHDIRVCDQVLVGGCASECADDSQRFASVLME